MIALGAVNFKAWIDGALLQRATNPRAVQQETGTEFPRHGQNHDPARTTYGPKPLRTFDRCL